MKKQVFLALFAALSIISCKNAAEKQNTTNAPTTPTAPAPPPPPPAPTAQCFQLNFKKDLTSCQILTDDKGNFVSGIYDWSPFEKDGGHGILKNGKIEGNMLTADFTYMIEGAVQTEEVYLKLETDKITQMQGELTEDKSGKLIVKDKTKLKAGDVLKKVDCAKIADIVSNIEQILPELNK